MALKKYKLGELIKQSEDRNKELKFSKNDVVGLSTQKIIIKTKADLTGVNVSSYKLFKPKHFAYVPDTSRRADKVSMGYNATENTFLVSSISTIFYVSREDILLSDYLFMYFNRPEFDRYARFNSWGSARETFDWSEMCDIDIELPSIEIQQKYINVYKAMVANQKAYEKGLDDLKLVCDAYIEDLRRKCSCEEIGKYIEETKIINTDGKAKLFGLSNDGFGKPGAMSKGTDITRYKIINQNDFAYPPPHFGNTGTIGLFKKEIGCVSPMYTTFKIANENLHPEYLFLWFKRSEFQRWGGFMACDSIRDTFDFKKLAEYKIPIPDISIQKCIAQMLNVYLKRKEINEKLKAQIKDLCPILIAGAMQEAKKEA